MKVKITKPPSHITPYDLAEWLCFWAKKERDQHGFENPPDWVHDFGEWLAYGKTTATPTPDTPSRKLFDPERQTTLLYRFMVWIQGFNKERISVRIDPWDTWSMDHTLAHIALPMLRQLRDNHMGYAMVDDEDVPEHLGSTAAPPLTQEQKDCHVSDENAEGRWLWVLDEMVFAFDSKINDEWEQQFHTGEPEYYTEVVQWDDEGRPLMHELKHGPNHTSEFDVEGYQAYQSRISNGFRLFGKYYESLWS